tara:strand:+ start:86841 stop:89855 length:3015 start_codon:yes stop_codon:yes gene_type:complete
MTKPFLWILILSALMFSAETGYSQAYNFSIYSVNEGLPHAQISDVIETSDGFMWIATSGAGVSKFDGHEFTTYDINHGLKDDFVNVVYEDSKKRIWVGTYYGGLTYLDGNQFVNPFEGHPIDDFYITTIKESPDGEIWFGTFESGIFIYDEESLVNISDEDGLANNAVWHFHWDPSGEVYISTHDGLSIFDGETFTNFGIDDGLSGSKVFKTVVDHEGKKWFPTSSGITIFENGQFSTIEEINEKPLRYVYDILAASNGDIWIGTENDGVFRYSSGEYFHITRREGLSSNYIHRIIEDSRGKIWIATDENGLNRFEGESFRVFNTGFGLPSNEILSLYHDRNGTIWIGTERGLSSFDGEQFNTYEILNMSQDQMYVWDIKQFEDGTVIITDYNGHLMKFDGERFSDFDIGLDPAEIYIYDLLIDSRNHLWIGSENGLFHFDGVNTTHYTLDSGLGGALIYHLFEDSDGTLWMGTNNGVSIFDGTTFKNILPSDGLSHYNVNYITKDREGRFWFGTSGGVTLFEPFEDQNSGTFQNFGREQGMKLIESNFLWVDEENEILWQGTNGGLQSLNLGHFNETGEMLIEHHRLSRYGIGVETTHKALVEKDGKLWFGSMNGLIVLDPSEIQSDNHIPIVHITDFYLNGSVTDWSEYGHELDYNLGLKQLPNITYPNSSNSYAFHFTGLDFSNPQAVEFRYRLEGLETGWNQPTKNRNTIYTNLSPGSYRFELQGRSGQGPWSDISSYEFSVEKPFWMRLWFWVLMILFIALILIGVIRSYAKKLERERLSSLVDERTAHLLQAVKDKEILVKEIHHRVKNNLAMIIGLLELQATRSTDETTINTLKDSILRIYSMSLVHEKLYSTDHLTNVDVKNYISDLINVITHSMNLYDQNITIKKKISSFTLSLDQGITCGLLINELVTNAIKHAFKGMEHGTICIEFVVTDEHKILTVTDDGIGFPDDFQGFGNLQYLEGASLGLTLITTLTKQMNGTLENIPQEKGSKIRITF